MIAYSYAELIANKERKPLELPTKLCLDGKNILVRESKNEMRKSVAEKDNVLAELRPNIKRKQLLIFSSL